MTTAAVPAPTTIPSVIPVRIPIREILPWAVFAVVIGLMLLYFVGSEQGAIIGADNLVHEFVHDGRHLLGFPCH